MKPATSRRVEGARHLAGEHNLFPRLVGMGWQRGSEQRLGIGVKRIGAKIEAVGHLDELAEIHDGRLAAEMRDSGKIVRDKQVADPQAAPGCLPASR